jgi:hypothetical protein
MLPRAIIRPAPKPQPSTPEVPGQHGGGFGPNGQHGPGQRGPGQGPDQGGGKESDKKKENGEPEIPDFGGGDDGDGDEDGDGIKNEDDSDFKPMNGTCRPARLGQSCQTNKPAVAPIPVSISRASQIGLPSNCTLIDRRLSVSGFTNVSSTSPTLPSYQGLSWTEGVSAVKYSDENVTFRRNFYLGTPRTMDTKAMNGCVLLFPNVTEAVNYDSRDTLAEVQGDCNAALSPLCVQGMLNQATDLDVFGLSTGDACRKLQASFTSTLNPACQAFAGTRWQALRVLGECATPGREAELMGTRAFWAGRETSYYGGRKLDFKLLARDAPVPRSPLCHSGRVNGMRNSHTHLSLSL